MALLSVACLAVAVWIVVADRLDTTSSTMLLIDDPQWGFWVTLAGAAAAVAVYLAIASLETAAAMRVLAPDHPLPARQPSILRIAEVSCGFPRSGPQTNRVGAARDGPRRGGSCQDRGAVTGGGMSIAAGSRSARVRARLRASPPSTIAMEITNISVPTTLTCIGTPRCATPQT